MLKKTDDVRCKERRAVSDGGRGLCKSTLTYTHTFSGSEGCSSAPGSFGALTCRGGSLLWAEPCRWDGRDGRQWSGRYTTMHRAVVRQHRSG